MNVFEADLSVLKARADKGDVGAQTELGTIYSTGTSEQRDYLGAFKYLGMAAEHGDTVAEYKLGRHYLVKGAKMDSIAATKWLRNAAEKDYAPAQEFLGRRYEHGSNKKNDSEAYFWLSLAAKKVKLNIASLNALEDAKRNLTVEQRTAIDRTVRKWKALNAPDNVSRRPMRSE